MEIFVKTAWVLRNYVYQNSLHFRGRKEHNSSIYKMFFDSYSSVSFIEAGKHTHTPNSEHWRSSPTIQKALWLFLEVPCRIPPRRSTETRGAEQTQHQPIASTG